MIYKSRALILLVILFLFVAFPVSAQAPAPIVINGTVSISTEVHDAINSWLVTDAPYPAPYYAPTYQHDKGPYTYVSLVALTSENWTLEGSETKWIGTIKVYDDGTIDLRSQHASGKGGDLLSSINPAAGGGSYVAFPWQAGTGVMYGPRGVHGSGGYGTSGMLAVDLVSGTDMGSSAAPDRVYGSDAGTIDYVCDDGTSVAVRTYNSSTGDYFIYAHMLNNASLEMDGTVSKGGLIGNLKHGTFKYPPEDYPGNCGWAQQADNHWHLHWMFVPAGGSFQAEDCILNVSSQKWACGSSSIGTGQYLVGGGGSGSGVDDVSGLGTASGGVASSNSLSMWDYLIIGIAGIFDPFWKLVPQHQGLAFVQTIYNSAEIVIRLLVVFAHGNINLGPVLLIFSASIVFNASLNGLWLIAFALKAYNSIFPKIPGIG